MDLLTIILLLMIGLLVSNIVSHYIPSIPTALTQIIIGIGIALLIGDFELETEWFLLLFVAPLLYNDGRHFSREELWGMRTQIFGNAFILVILTTVVCGYIIHYLIPGMPLAAAFALAAILSPTDPVAVNGIAKRINIPEKVMVLVRGESLINDASGLVAFKYAIAAAVTGYFSLREAVVDFSYTFLVGAIAGIILSLMIIFLRFRLRKNGITDPVFHSLLHILTPFVIFIITEHFLHASGVIAVVAAGIIYSIVAERTETHMAEEHLLTENTWSILLFVLNGFVFLMLGMNIPSAMFDTIVNNEIETWRALGYVVGVGFLVLAVRFIWSLISSVYAYRKNGAEKPTVKNSLITALVGVRGALTMAGVLTVPVFLDNGDKFPLRSLIIFVAAGVILLLLILATVLLPLICRKEPSGESTEEGADLTWAKNRLLLTAIKKIKAETNEENEVAAAELINEYTVSFHRNLSKQVSDKEQEEYNQKLNEVRIYALNLERKHINHFYENGEIDIKIYDSLSQLLDFREESLDHNIRFGTLLFMKRVMREFGRLLVKKRKNEKDTTENFHIVRDIRIKSKTAVIQELEEYAKNHEKPEYVYAVILEYEKMLQSIKRSGERDKDNLEEKKEELRFKVLDAERNEIRRMFETGEITAAQKKELRRFTNQIESIVLYEHRE